LYDVVVIYISDRWGQDTSHFLITGDGILKMGECIYGCEKDWAIVRGFMVGAGGSGNKWGHLLLNRGRC